VLPARLRLVLIGVVACAVAAVAGVFIADARRDDGVIGARPTGFEGTRRPAGMVAPELALRDQDGKRVRMEAFAGSPVVVTFVYATCRDTCPAQMQSIRGALDDLGEDVPVLAVSVDPANDTAARARRFLAEQRMTGRARFLLGSREKLAPVWRAYGIQPQRDALDHTAYAILLDRAHRQRVGWPYDVLTVEGLTSDLRRLLAERA
jgi:protein SCO1/2